MIQHQQQGFWECFPTSLAMLYGVPRETFIAAALPHGADNWAQAIIHGWECVMEVTHVFAPWAIPTVMQFRRGEPATPKWRVLARKRGVIFIRFQDGSGHAVAFERGRIHDPILPEPMPAREWVRAQKCVGFYVAVAPNQL